VRSQTVDARVASACHCARADGLDDVEDPRAGKVEFGAVGEPVVAAGFDRDDVEFPLDRPAAAPEGVPQGGRQGQ
jgi:hypothetical protein